MKRENSIHETLALMAAATDDAAQPEVPVKPTNGTVVAEKDGSKVTEETSWRGVFNQGLMAGAIFLLTCGSGFPMGFSATFLPRLQAEDSDIPTSIEMGSWIASIHSAGTPFGTLLSGYVADRWGRRQCMRVCVPFLTAAWLVMAFAQSHWMILLARLMGGFAVGLGCVPTQVVLGEVSSPRLRGFLSGFNVVSYSFGILVVYGLGAAFPWRTVALLAIVLPLASFVATSLLPESPVWLARHDRMDDAEEALYWFRGGPLPKAQLEFEELKSRVAAETLQSTTAVGPPESTACWSTFTKAAVLKPFAIVIAFQLLQIVSGTFLVIFYAVDILRQASGDDFDSFMAAVLTGAIRCLFTIITCVLLYFVRRRLLALLSGFGSGLAAIALGTVFFVKTLDTVYMDPQLESTLILTFLIVYIALNTCGFFVLPGICIAELLPAKVRGLAGGYVFTAFNVCMFLAAKCFPFVNARLGSHGVFWLFGASSLAGSCFVFLFLPETRGRTLNEIEDYFKQPNVLWVTREREGKEKGDVLA